MSAPLRFDIPRSHSNGGVVFFGTTSAELERGVRPNDVTIGVFFFAKTLTELVRIHPPKQEPTQLQKDKVLSLPNLLAEVQKHPVPFPPVKVPPHPEGLDWLFL